MALKIKGCYQSTRIKYKRLRRTSTIKKPEYAALLITSYAAYFFYSLKKLKNSIQKEIANQLNLLVAELVNINNKELLTKKDVMKMLHVSLSTVDRWMRTGTLKAFGVEGKVYYKRSDVEAMLTPLN